MSPAERQGEPLALAATDASVVVETIARLIALTTSGATPEPSLMDVESAAAYMAVSRKFLREASLNGEVAYVELRGRGAGARDLMRWRREDLDDWAARCRVAANSAGAVLNTKTPAKPTKHATAPVALRKASSAAKGGPVLSARDAIRKKAA